MDISSSNIDSSTDVLPRHIEKNHVAILPLTLRRLMSYIYIYGAPILDVSRSHTTTQHSR